MPGGADNSRGAGQQCSPAVYDWGLLEDSRAAGQAAIATPQSPVRPPSQVTRLLASAKLDVPRSTYFEFRKHTEISRYRIVKSMFSETPIFTTKYAQIRDPACGLYHICACIPAILSIARPSTASPNQVIDARLAGNSVIEIAKANGATRDKKAVVNDCRVVLTSQDIFHQQGKEVVE
jgi:hypothetical protein